MPILSQSLPSRCPPTFARYPTSSCTAGHDDDDDDDYGDDDYSDGDHDDCGDDDNDDLDDCDDDDYDDDDVAVFLTVEIPQSVLGLLHIISSR